MMKMTMSPAAAGLIRALLARAGVPREEVLISTYRSTDWHSLTFAGERHEIGLRIAGHDAAATVERMVAGLEEAEFSITGQIVADIALEQPPHTHRDGSVSIAIEALTIAA